MREERVPRRVVRVRCDRLKLCARFPKVDSAAHGEVGEECLEHVGGQVKQPLHALVAVALRKWNDCEVRGLHRHQTTATRFWQPHAEAPGFFIQFKDSAICTV